MAMNKISSWVRLIIVVATIGMIVVADTVNVY